ncbi:UNVERIFIED_CONTAM: hypothetical protein ABID98_005907 [Brevibacillus sp. OAP136]
MSWAGWFRLVHLYGSGRIEKLLPLFDRKKGLPLPMFPSAVEPLLQQPVQLGTVIGSYSRIRLPKMTCQCKCLESW